MKCWYLLYQVASRLNPASPRLAAATRYKAESFRYLAVRIMVVNADGGEVAALCSLEARRDVDLELEGIKAVRTGGRAG